MTQRTLLIWSVANKLPKLYIVEGDYSHLDGVMLNANAPERYEEELNNLGRSINKDSAINVSNVNKGNIEMFFDFVIRCGIAP